jgi:hypothetical protein
MSPEEYQQRMRELGIARGAFDPDGEFLPDQLSVVPDLGPLVDKSKRMGVARPPIEEDLSRFASPGVRIVPEREPFYRALEKRGMTRTAFGALIGASSAAVGRWLAGACSEERKRAFCALLTPAEFELLPEAARPEKKDTTGRRAA